MDWHKSLAKGKKEIMVDPLESVKTEKLKSNLTNTYPSFRRRSTTQGVQVSLTESVT